MKRGMSDVQGATNVLSNFWIFASIMLIMDQQSYLSRKAICLSFSRWSGVVCQCRDLMSWIKSMMALVSSDELAKDVTGAEALLERHKVC